MAGLARYLRQRGYAVANLGYPSRRMRLEGLADDLYPIISAWQAAHPGPLHMVGHSMGGLVIRALLARYPALRPQRVVMIGTPNQGSEVADFLRNNRLYRWVYGPAGQQLCCAPPRAGLPDAFPAVLGVIAGNRCYDPLCGRLIGRESDGKVSVESTRLAGMRDHCILPVGHSTMPARRCVHEAVAHFLAQGKFA